MATEYYTAIDVVETMYENLLNQYKESPNLINYLTTLLKPFTELEQVFADILNLRLFENAADAQLEGVGALVGQDRAVYDSSEILYFGMDGDTGSGAGGVDPVAHLGMGDVDDVTIGGYFRSITQPIAGRAYLEDGDYNLFIDAKIKRNNFSGGEEALLSIIHNLLELDLDAGETVNIIEDFTSASDPFLTIVINKVLSVKQQSFLTLTEILPRPAGMRYEYEDSNGSF